MLGNAAGHGGAAGSTLRQDEGTSRTLVKAKPWIRQEGYRQGLTNPIPGHGAGPAALRHPAGRAGHSPGDGAGMLGRGLVAGGRQDAQPLPG